MHLYPRRIHFVGIGGAGMSALAEVLKSYGHFVTGSDTRKSTVTARLESLGIGVQYDHEPKLVSDADLLVYSSAVRPDNPERRYAVRHGIVTMRRAELLGDIMRAKFSIGVSGTHGKTTTTSLIGHVLTHAGLQPTIIVGGTLRGKESNAVVGRGELLVAEADEYDRSFLSMYPSIALITNIEADHLDCYRDLDDIRTSFFEYAGRVPFFGAVVACADDENVRDIMSRVERVSVSYATHHAADYVGRNMRFENGKSTYTVVRHGKALGSVEIPLMGLHNVRNSLGTVAVCCEMGVAFDAVCDGLRSFSGIRRRFEQVGVESGICVIDDYAHHPSEIAATLSAASECGFGRVVAVFQPHLYSRTRDFMDAFCCALSRADKVIVTGIYKAREEPIEGVSARNIVELMKRGGHADVEYVEARDDVPKRLAGQLQYGDGVIVMGAGDICDVGAMILERIRHG